MNWTFVEAKWKNPASGTCGGYIIHSSELYYDWKLTVGNGLHFVMSNVKSVAYCVLPVCIIFGSDVTASH